MFQRGREMHSPSTASQRRASDASLMESLTKTTTNQSTASSSSSTTTNAAGTAGPDSPVVNYNPNWGSQHRRRSSAASLGSAGMFANLTNNKRGSVDYQARRNDHAEMEGKSGVLNSMWNSTFRGMQTVKDVTMEKAAEAKKGIME